MPTSTITSQLGVELLSVVARLNRFATQRAHLALPYAQARLLAQIEERGEARISELAVADHTSQPTMTTQVQRLEAGGWVTRRHDPSDGRAVLVSVTPAGAAALQSVRRERAAVIDPELERLSAADQQTLSDAVAILRRVLTNHHSPKE